MQNDSQEHPELSHPEINWNSALEDLLCSEAEKCSGLSWLHAKSEALFTNLNNCFEIISIVLSTTFGAISLAGPTIFPQHTDLICVLIGVASLVCSTIGMLNSHFTFAKRSEGHRLGSIQYAQIYRMITIEMSLPRPQRMPPKNVLRYVRDDLKRLMETLPRIADSAISSYKREIMPSTPEVSHPDITNGVHRVEVFVQPLASPHAFTPVFQVVPPGLSISPSIAAQSAPQIRKSNSTHEHPFAS